VTAIADVADLYVATFAARHDVCSPWIETPEGGQWICAREPLTADVVLAAFRSGRPVATYMLDADSTTQLAALDIDLEDGLMLADRVARVMTKAGCPAYVETSRRGGHLWCSIGPFALPGIVVRRALRAFLQEAGIEPDPKIELRPGQDRLSGPDGVGTALRMPLMPHQKTGVKGVLMAPGGRIVAEKMHEALEAVETAPTATFAAWAERWAPPEPILSPARDPGDRPRGIDRFNADVGVSEVLRDDWHVANALPGKSVSCPSPDHGGPDRHPSCRILADDRRLFCHNPGCGFHNAGRGRDAYDLAKMAGTVGRVT
jgi:hypothetical protein